MALVSEKHLSERMMQVFDLGQEKVLWTKLTPLKARDMKTQTVAMTAANGENQSGKNQEM